MLYILYKDKDGNSHQHEWHVGEPIPRLYSQAAPRVITFQADGDELNLIYDAMEGSKNAY